MMSRPVVTRKASPIHTDRDIEILQGNVVDHHVISALHEGRVNRQERFESLCCHTASKESSMFFRDTDIEILIWMFCRKMGQTGPGWHRRSDGCDLLVIVGELCQRLTEDFRVSWRAAFSRLSAVLLELT